MAEQRACGAVRTICSVRKGLSRSSARVKPPDLLARVSKPPLWSQVQLEPDGARLHVRVVGHHYQRPAIVAGLGPPAEMARPHPHSLSEYAKSSPALA
jgi:hypothetical protein